MPPKKSLVAHGMFEDKENYHFWMKIISEENIKKKKKIWVWFFPDYPNYTAFAYNSWSNPATATSQSQPELWGGSIWIFSLLLANQSPFVFRVHSGMVTLPKQRKLKSKPEERWKEFRSSNLPTSCVLVGKLSLQDVDSENCARSQLVSRMFLLPPPRVLVL